MSTPEQEQNLRDLAFIIEGALQQIYGEKMLFMLNIAPPSQEGGLSHYISNADRNDCIAWMKETAERFENNEIIPEAQGQG